MKETDEAHAAISGAHHSKLIRVEGAIAAVLGAGFFSVRLSGGESLRVRISRRPGLLQAASPSAIACSSARWRDRKVTP
jgi:hypothetical protein